MSTKITAGIRAIAFAILAAGASAAAAEETEVHLLFVQGADAMTADTEAKTIRLVGVAENTVYFSDRPARVAGLIDTADFVEHWGTGDDSFASNPPNATLMVHDVAEERNRGVVVVLTQPMLDGADLVYTYETLGGEMPGEGGATGLFIDTFGPGGGVGATYHGAGVGRRGPGAAGWAGVAVRDCADGSC